MSYKPLSREFLLNRGYCCKNNCLNCPWKENIVNKPLSREFLLNRGYCCKNNCLNCPWKENIVNKP